MSRLYNASYAAFKIIPSLKTRFNTSIDVKFMFDSACLSANLAGRIQVSKYSPNSRCHPSSCLLAVLAMFLANSSPNSSL